MSGAADNLVLSTLARWWLPSDRDHLTTADASERPVGRFEGQQFYVPRAPIAGTHPLYRLYLGTDHMDSVTPEEGGYATESILGWPFDGREPGTDLIRRGWDQASDHTISRQADELADLDYTEEDPLGFGYPRFGNDGEPQLWVRGDEVEIAANQAAGGAICELWWNGKQFINNWDYGRQIQIAMNLLPIAETDNPTEGGDKYGAPNIMVPGWAHGSPLLEARVNGKTLKTSCHPLQWTPEAFGGGTGNPVMWQGRFAKRLDLDWQGNPRVIRWTTTVDFPSAESYVDLEILTAYLTAEFSRFYAYNAEAGDLSPLGVAMDTCIDPSMDARLRPPAGGVIIATEDDAYALGIYRRAPDGEQNNYGLCSFVQAEGGKYGPGGAKWNLLYRPQGGVGAGQLSFEAFLLVGSTAEVFAAARTLFANGA